MSQTSLPVRSFKLRRGRITAGQQRALDTLWHRYGVDLGGGPLDLPAIFGRVAPVILDIGFGMGETTLAMAAADPDRDILAVDVHTPGAGALLHAVHEQGVRNVRVAVADVRDVLAAIAKPGSLDEIRVFFPDPWPKAKHGKRRLLDAEFVHLAAMALRPGGIVHCATDWTPYARSILAVTAAEPLLANDFGGYARRPSHRPITRFERQGMAKGHDVHDIVCHRHA